MPTRTPPIALALALAACGGAQDAPRDDDTGAPATVDRPDTVTDTILIEGMPERIALRLFHTPDGFPLPFTAYLPSDMASETSEGEGAAGPSVRFVAEFGGVRNDRALIHLFVQPEGTDPQQALALVRAYQAGTGVPVSRGLEPLGDPEALRRMPWADHAYAIRYQAGGAWYLGSIGLGSRDGRLYHLVTHYPAEYADGFAPRSALVLDTWRWADGSPLRSGADEADLTLPSARADSLLPDSP